MGYLDGKPEFHHQLLLVRGDALWLVSDERGAWALPGLVSDEQHTAEVELIARHMRERFGVRIVILGRVATEFDAAATRLRKADLAEPLVEPELRSGRWWPRAALAGADAPLAADSRALVARWAAGDVAVVADTPWSRPGWHAGALAWISAVAGPVGDVEQVRVSEFSTVLRVQAGGRPRYFKSVAEAAAREPPVTAALAGRSAHLPPVLAVDAARRFLLMEAFAGEPLAAPEDVGAWTAAAQAYGELQRQCLDAVDELRGLGCAVATAASLAAPLASLLDDRGALLAGEPAGLGDRQVAVLRALVPELAAAAAALDAGPLPPALDHGDLWPSNVLVGPAGCAFVDWEDARVAHPFLSLFHLLTGACLDRRFADHAAAAARIRDAYLAGWSAWARREDLSRAFDAAHDVAAVAAAASYRRYSPPVVQAHPWMREMPAFCLSRILVRRAMAGRFQHGARDQQRGSYRIRLARPDEVSRLREIEDEAGTIFSGLGLIDEALDASFPLDDLARLVGLGQVWVGCLEDDLPVGMAIASVREGAVYVEEMDVLPAHGRRGLGARLLGRVCAWAEAQGHAAVTLSTFRDVPWNGPFYRKHGFRELRPAEWTPGMRAIREKEAQHGLRVEARVFMRKELGGVGPAA